MNGFILISIEACRWPSSVRLYVTGAPVSLSSMSIIIEGYITIAIARYFIITITFLTYFLQSLSKILKP